MLTSFDHHEKDQQIDWSELPDHIVSLIAVKLIHIKDYIRFGAVCHAWHSIYCEDRHSLLRQPPLLLLATELNNNDDPSSLYSLVENKVLSIQVPVPHDRFCAGSSHGWLVVVSNDWEITLLNPFMSVNNVIKLPSALTFEDDKIHLPNVVSAEEFGDVVGFVIKVVLSDNPASNPNYVAMANYSDFRWLAFFKPGDKVWRFTMIMDVIYYQDKFYFINQKRRVFSCDLNRPRPKVKKVARFRKSLCPPRICLVESAGELLQVCRFTKLNVDNIPDDVGGSDNDLFNDYFNIGFIVYKLDLVELKWIKMNNLHGHVLFLGDNCSYSLSASDFTELRPNSIYFTDDYCEGYYEMAKKGLRPHDMGIFNLEDRTHEQRYPTDSNMIILLETVQQILSEI